MVLTSRISLFHFILVKRRLTSSSYFLPACFLYLLTDNPQMVNDFENQSLTVLLLMPVEVFFTDESRFVKYIEFFACGWLFPTQKASKTRHMIDTSSSSTNEICRTNSLGTYATLCAESPEKNSEIH